MRTLYADTPSAELAARLGTTIDRVYEKAHKMGLRKSAAFLAAYGGRLNAEHSRGMKTRFREGSVPWNRGKKGLMLSVTSVFQPGTRHGQALRNWVPLGSTRINSDGYLVIKIHDTMSAPQNLNWRAAHRVVWERERGAVPDGFAIVFKPGRRSTELDKITLDALEMIPRAELMRRNSVQRYPDELRRLVQLKGVLSRTINRKEKEEAT
jgi:hypothetical protein